MSSTPLAIDWRPQPLEIDGNHDNALVIRDPVMVIATALNQVTKSVNDIHELVSNNSGPYFRRGLKRSWKGNLAKSTIRQVNTKKPI